LDFFFVIFVCIPASLIWGFSTYFITSQLRKTSDFLTGPIANNYKHRLDKIIFFTLKFWGVMFIISFFSFNILWFVTLPIWGFVIFVFYYFVKLWKYHGYSSFILLFSTFIIVILSFISTSLLRDIIF